MQHVWLSAPSSPALRTFPAPYASEDREAQVQQDQRFIRLLDLYRSTGGLVRAEELVTLLQRRGALALAALPGWVLGGEVICFEWHDTTWLPLFQFDAMGRVAAPQLGPVLAELNCIYDPWDTANWFVQPQLWLDLRRPVDLLASDPLAVLNAARAERLAGAARERVARHLKHEPWIRAAAGREE